MGHNNEMESTAKLCILRSPGAVSWTEPERHPAPRLISGVMPLKHGPYIYTKNLQFG